MCIMLYIGIASNRGNRAPEIIQGIETRRSPGLDFLAADARTLVRKRNVEKNMNATG